MKISTQQNRCLFTRSENLAPCSTPQVAYPSCPHIYEYTSHTHYPPTLYTRTQNSPCTHTTHTSYTPHNTHTGRVAVPPPRGRAVGGRALGVPTTTERGPRYCGSGGCGGCPMSRGRGRRRTARRRRNDIEVQYEGHSSVYVFRCTEYHRFLLKVAPTQYTDSHQNTARHVGPEFDEGEAHAHR